ncbi:MAG: hypothetical protein IIZ06_07760 [Kiritimatiellae bacterium]|jgi:hypothetical protein|nr:hypothetical protein [Kiritimatiellia bacterium]
MKKWLVKLLMPSGKTLAGLAADGISKAVNESGADTREKVAKFSRYAETVTSVAYTLSHMVEDGNISKLERDALVEMLTPTFEKIAGLL